MSAAPKPEQKPLSARDLRGVGNELAGLASELSHSLRSDWVRGVAEDEPDPSSNIMEKSTAVCIRWGQRLGELSLSTARAETLAESEVDSLHEASVRDSHSRLARMGSRASFLLSTRLPALMEHRSSLTERLTNLSARWLKERGDYPFRWHRFLFYLIPALLVLGAEGALAEDITRSAFRLKGVLWFLFPIALLSLPLIFKELLEWGKLDRLQKGYVVTLLVLLLALLIPLSWTRSNEVFRGSVRAAAAASSDPFATAPNTPGAPAASPPVGMPQRPGSDGKLLLLSSIFAIFGALFPMVSGLCFYRAWGMADKGLECWRVRKEGEQTRKELDAIDAQIGTCRTELDSNQHETVKLIAGLSSGDRFVEKMVADLVGSLHGAGPEIVASVKQKIGATLGEWGWPELAKWLALEVEALELSGGPLQQVRVKFQKDLLSGVAQIDKGDSLGNQAETLKKRIRAALSEGYEVGTQAPFAVMATHSPEEMVELVRQRKLRDALFRSRRRAVAPSPASST
jgi:hypothetical protein